mmetsp:Transcript_25744/g.42045  ORF Transcript_25744/g.42045 Transcript_25744/m.42045 type:complete len:218 (+) Transcript_25744:33-686(+)
MVEVIRQDIALKFVLYGDTTVGKSSILQKFSGEPLPKKHVKTESEETRTRTVFIDDYRLTIDIHEKPSLDNIAHANACIYVYDVTNKKSFEYIKDLILRQRETLKKERSQVPMMMVLANKIDSDSHAVAYEDGHDFCTKMGILFYQVSVAKDTGILSQAIMRLAAKVINRDMVRPEINKTLTLKHVMIVCGCLLLVGGIVVYKVYKRRTGSNNGTNE